MTDERKDEAPAASEEERPKRAPPTIDLDASDVSGDKQAGGGDAGRGSFKGAAQRTSALRSWLGAALSRLAAPLSGAIAAMLVIAALWAGGLLGPRQPAQTPVSRARFESVAANVGDLSARLARVEASAAQPAAPATDPTLGGRTEAVEKSLSTAREEIARLSAELSTVSASLNELRSTPRDGAAPAPDLAPLDQRLTRLEDATRRLASELAKAPAASADDSNVRRLVVANALDAAVRRNEPFASALAAAKQVASDPAALAPLDAFAARGIPTEATYLRDIVPILQRIADGGGAKSEQNDVPAERQGAGVLDRLQAGLAKLVRIERDTGPAAGRDDPPSPAAVAAAVRREDLAAARQDVAKLPQAADPQIQAWIKQVDAREAALAASQRFSAEALAAFGKSGQ
jgi:hypothetical protein